MQVDCDVVVVGAGYAGLIATRNLIEVGKSVVLLEAGSRVGGRALSENYPGTEMMVDWGAEWVLPEHHHALMAEAKRYGVALEFADETPLTQWHINGHGFQSSFKDLVAGNPGVEEILKRLENAAADYTETGLEPIQTLSDFLKKEAKHDADLVNAALFSLTGAHPDNLALAMVLNEIRYHGGSIDETLNPSEISRLEGGAGKIAKRIAAELPAGTIRFGHSVNGVKADNSTMIVSGEFGLISANKAILALPLNILKNIEFSPSLPKEIEPLIAQSHAGRTAKFWAIAHGESVPEECNIIGHPFKLTYAKPLERGRYLVCAQALSDDVQDMSEATLSAAFQAIYQSLDMREVYKHDWVFDPLALGSWHAGRPGQETGLKAMREPFGKMVVCGGDFSDPWSGWIEGAVLSGAKAAKWAARTFS